MTKKKLIIDQFFSSCYQKKLSLKEVARFNKMFGSSNIVIEEGKKTYSPDEWERKTKRERKKLIKETIELFQ